MSVDFKLSRVHQVWIDQRLLTRAICGAPSLYATGAVAFRALTGGLPGGMAECGVASGVHPAVMHYCMRYAGQYKTIWLFDSFFGIPRPTSRDVPSPERPGRDARDFMGSELAPDGEIQVTGRAAVSLEEVKRCMTEWGALEEHLRYVPGWFHESIPRTHTGPLALLRVDADLYESTRVAFDCLYDSVVPGGYVGVHDWDLAGVHAAVLDSIGEEPDVTPVPETGPVGLDVWWRKP